MLQNLRKRQVRTIVLALVAAGAFVGSAIWIFDADPRAILEFFIAAVIGLLLIMTAALCFTALRLLLRRWFS